VIALSQSGQTPDVLEYVQRARRRGAFTVAVTNDVDSDLAAEAHAVLPLEAGPERAVAATKTYTATLAALALLAAHAAGRGDEVATAIRRTADLLDGLLPVLEARLSEVAVSLAFVGRMFVIGRGPEYATAREISLKLLETCRIAAEPLTATDLVHGPVAAIDGLFPVWTVASADESLPAVREATARARAASVAVYVFVAATARSGPASSGSTACASAARSESTSFVTATVNAPRRRARRTYSSTSGVWPDCESAITHDRLTSTSAP